MKTFEKVFDKVTNIVETFVFVFSATLIIGVSALICLEMVMRNIGRSMVIVEELALIALGWISFFAGAYCFRKRGHVMLDLVFAKLPQHLKLTLYTLTYAVGIIFMIWIIYEARHFTTMLMRTPMVQSGLPRGLINMGLPVGGSFIVFFLVTDLIETHVLKRRRSLMTQDELQSIAIAAAKEKYVEDLDLNLDQYKTEAK